MTIPGYFGTVVGRFLEADGSAQSGKVVLVPAPSYFLDALDAGDPTTIKVEAILCTLDSSGYLIGPDGTQGATVVATDSADLNPVGWTYSVYVIANGSAPRAFSVSVPTGATVDLTVASPVDSSLGTPVVYAGDAAIAGFVNDPETATGAALAATYATVVSHGSTAGMARPSGATYVRWVGTVTPTNATNGDAYLNTATGDEQVKVAGTFIALSKANNDATYAAHGEAFDPNDVGSDVWVLMGQSNMVGYGTGVDTALDRTDPRILQWPARGSYVGSKILASEPLLNPEVKTNTVGHALGFARDLLLATKPNRTILLIPAAYGSTGFTTSSLASPPAGYTTAAGGSWDPAAGSGGIDRLQSAIDAANAAIAAGSGNRIAGFLWLQGEADASALTESQYATKLDALIDRCRSAVTGASATTPFLVGQMVPDYLGTPAGRGNINHAHIDTPHRKVGTAFYYGPVGSAYDNGDSNHYNPLGQRTLAAGVFPALLRARANVLSTAPVAPSSVTLVQSGTSVTATIVQPVCRATRYLFEYQIGAGAWTTVNNTATPIDRAVTITGLTAGNVITVRVSTVNEAGTSATTASTPLTVVAAPGQVTGVTAGTATASTQPITWTALTGATSYLVEYKAHSSGTWLTSGTVTGTAATVTGLTASTSYDYRVTGSNAAGSGTASATLTTSTAALSALLSDMAVTGGATLFYGFSLARKIVSGYAGSAIRVRRSSDNATLDVGFTGGGDLDESALTTWLGSADGFVNIFYDQSGSARNFTISTTSAQPKIATAGALNKINGKVYANFNGTSHGGTDSTTGLYAAGSASAMHVAKASGSGTGSPGLMCENGATSTPLYGIGDVTTTYRNLVFIRDDSNSILVNSAQAGALLTTNPHATCNVDDGGFITQYGDGTAGAPISYSRGTITLTTRGIGKLQGATWFAGDVTEMVAFTGALTSAEVARGQANQKSYFGTP